METISIGEVAKGTGVSQSAIRYYESLGLLSEPPRSGGWRRYDGTVIERLRVIRVARELGFTLDEIKVLLEGFSAETPPPERWRALAARKLPEVEAMARRALAMKALLDAGLGCACVRIEDCFLDGCAPPPRAGRRMLPIVKGA